MRTLDKQYKVVFFDLGGTLRIAFDDEPYERHARRKMAELACTDLPVEEFYQIIEDRYEPYRKWALEENRESDDLELWSKWLLPDADPNLIRHVCHELSFQYRQAKGRREVVTHGKEVVAELCRRGYRLGIISNLIGENEVPDWLEEDGLAPYFECVVLSSVCGLRKPRPGHLPLRHGKAGRLRCGLRLRGRQPQAGHPRRQEGRHRLQHPLQLPGAEVPPCPPPSRRERSPTPSSTTSTSCWSCCPPLQ
jgi:FMN phosphatase YigB (HAD superfamily)